MNFKRHRPKHQRAGCRCGCKDKKLSGDPLISTVRQIDATVKYKHKRRNRCEHDWKFEIPTFGSYSSASPYRDKKPTYFQICAKCRKIDDYSRACPGYKRSGPSVLIRGVYWKNVYQFKCICGNHTQKWFEDVVVAEEKAYEARCLGRLKLSA